MAEKQSLFTADSSTGKELFRWWEDLRDDRASRAVLKRCSTPLEVVMTASYQRLYQRLVLVGLQRVNPDRDTDHLPAAIGLLAHVRTNTTTSLPTLFSNSDPLPLHPLRFRSLLESSDVADLYTGLRRALPLIDHVAPVLDLAHDVYYWGDGVKRRWVYDYHWPSKAA